MAGGQGDQGELLPLADPVMDWNARYHEVGKVFTPNTPVSEMEVFAGRDAQITRILDVIAQTGQHAVLFGERGVGKTSLANLLSDWLYVRDKSEQRPIASPRVNCNSADSFDGVWRKVLDRIDLTDSKRGVGFAASDEDVIKTGEELLDPRYQSDGEHPQSITPDVVRKVLVGLARYCIPIVVIDEFDRLDDETRRMHADLVKMLSDFDVHATIVLVGVAETVDGLLHDHESVGRALVQVQMPRMSRAEIRQILVRGT
jgi:Cdc6-like AAA superfamily ATPase